MRYFVCHSPYDFPFSVLDEACQMLVSPTNMPPNYRYPAPLRPVELFVDSGAYHHNERRTGKSQVACMAEQLGALEAFEGQEQVTLLHCDVLHREGMQVGEAVHRTLQHAQEFGEAVLPAHVSKMAVAQGGTPEEMFLVIRFLRELGFERIAVGGLARLHRKQRSLMRELVEASGEAGEGVVLHALGATGSTILPLLKKMDFASCDSAAPVWGAVYGRLLFSDPMRWYRVKGERSDRVDVLPNTSYYELLDAPLSCPCPVCREDPLLMFGESMLAKHLRSIHNYCHLKVEVEGDHVWQKLCSSAEFQSATETYLTSMLLSPATPRWISGN